MCTISVLSAVTLVYAVCMLFAVYTCNVIVVSSHNHNYVIHNLNYSLFTIDHVSYANYTAKVRGTCMVFYTLDYSLLLLL